MKRVVMVGGTHGNELGGIYLQRLWREQPLHWRDFPFEVETLLANPGAIAANRRYLDQDLNRSFLPAELADIRLASYEAQRAKVLAEHLKGSDFIFDLHNTTSAMGITLILSRPEALDDLLTRQLCYHLCQDPWVRVYYHETAAQQNPYLPSVAARDMTVEVGPMAHGTLQADLFFKTRELMESALQFLADWELEQVEPASGTLTVYEHLDNVDYPRTPEGELAGMVHPSLQGRDFEPLEPGEAMFISFQGETIPYTGTERVWPVFINEQAYYEKLFALSLTRQKQIPL